MKIGVGSGSGVGSGRGGGGDPNQNVMDPQHWFILILGYLLQVATHLFTQPFITLLNYPNLNVVIHRCT
jgi:hypothetical protein